jgi:hypothetical protein
MKAEERTTTSSKWLGGNQKRLKGGLLEARRGNIGDVTPTAPFVPGDCSKLVATENLVSFEKHNTG